MAYSTRNNESDGVWFVYSGCSNHMTGDKSLFKDLDESLKSEVRLGDNKLVKVEGKGSIAIVTQSGITKLLNDVQIVPSLAHNLIILCSWLCMESIQVP